MTFASKLRISFMFFLLLNLQSICANAWPLLSENGEIQFEGKGNEDAQVIMLGANPLFRGPDEESKAKVTLVSYRNDSGDASFAISVKAEGQVLLQDQKPTPFNISFSKEFAVDVYGFFDGSFNDFTAPDGSFHLKIKRNPNGFPGYFLTLDLNQLNVKGGLIDLQIKSNLVEQTPPQRDGIAHIVAQSDIYTRTGSQVAARLGQYGSSHCYGTLQSISKINGEAP